MIDKITKNSRQKEFIEKLIAADYLKYDMFLSGEMVDVSITLTDIHNLLIPKCKVKRKKNFTSLVKILGNLQINLLIV